jgi:hypothetical protein
MEFLELIKRRSAVPGAGEAALAGLACVGDD